MATDMTVANTILAQLGGKRFAVMTGASYFTATDNSLSMALPGSARYNGKRVNGMMITLEPSDTYKVEVLFAHINRGKGFERKVIETRDDIYAENLRDVFTTLTGLYTSLKG